MKIFFAFLLIISAAQAFASATIDINILHERSSFEVKETVCGWTPDPEKGYLADENGCFYTKYKLKAPVYGFDFTPRTRAVLQPARAAYYVQFLGPNIPAEEKLHAEIISGGEKVRDITSVFHDNTLQGTGILAKGETIRLYSDEEPSYAYIYIITVIIIIFGVAVIVRRKR